MAQRKDVVMRISDANHKRLKQLMTAVVESGKKKPAINQLLEEMLDSMETLTNGEVLYLVEDKIFNDLTEARGECILNAVKKKEIPEWPKIVVVIGHDGGA